MLTIILIISFIGNLLGFFSLNCWSWNDFNFRTCLLVLIHNKLLIVINHHVNTIGKTRRFVRSASSTVQVGSWGKFWTGLAICSCHCGSWEHPSLCFMGNVATVLLWCQWQQVCGFAPSLDHEPLCSFPHSKTHSTNSKRGTKRHIWNQAKDLKELMQKEPRT